MWLSFQCKLVLFLNVLLVVGLLSFLSSEESAVTPLAGTQTKAQGIQSLATPSSDHLPFEDDYYDDDFSDSVSADTPVNASKATNLRAPPTDTPTNAPTEQDPTALKPRPLVYEYPAPPGQSPEELMECIPRKEGITQDTGKRLSAYAGYAPMDLGEWFFHQQMKNSPSLVTTNPAEADYFVVNLMPVLSSIAGECNGKTHEERQLAWKGILEKSPQFAQHPLEHLMVCQTWGCRDLVRDSMKPLVAKMTYLIHERNMYWTGIKQLDPAQILVVPYTGHSKVDPFSTAVTDTSLSRLFKLSFVGTVGRASRWRDPLHKILKNKDDANFKGFNIHDSGFKQETKHHWNLTYAQQMVSSDFCLVPEGYTPSSRRLTDAMLAGCIPVFVGQAYDRPFEELIPYDSFALQLDGKNWMGGHHLEELQRVWDISDQELRARREEMARYIKFMDWRHGTAIFEGVLDELSLWKQNVRHEIRVVTWDCNVKYQKKHCSESSTRSDSPAKPTNLRLPATDPPVNAPTEQDPTASKSRPLVYEYPSPPGQSPEELMECINARFPKRNITIDTGKKGFGYEGYLQEDIGEWFLHQQMRNSPRVMTTDPSKADYFVFNFMPILSSLAQKCNGKTHEERQMEWKGILEKSPQFAQHPRRHAMVCQTWHCGNLIHESLKPLVAKMNYLIHEQNLVWTGLKGQGLKKDQILLVPYVGHSGLNPLSDAVTDTSLPRQFKLTFIGTVSRKSRWRDPLGKILKNKNATKALMGLNVHNQGVEKSAHGGLGSNLTYAQQMMSSDFCLVPEGDTPSSRRLMDAMLAGCIPVFAGSGYRRPFEDIIPYESFAFHLNGERWLKGHHLEELQRVWDISDQELRARREEMAEFIKFMDWRHGNATFEGILDGMGSRV